jgi:hypothetical protein
MVAVAGRVVDVQCMWISPEASTEVVVRSLRNHSLCTMSFVLLRVCLAVGW